MNMLINYSGAQARTGSQEAMIRYAHAPAMVYIDDFLLPRCMAVVSMSGGM